ncbi:MAG TPA: GTPase [Desulfurococcales archaeon]|nr:GTPase [Desulfurococcales archaeon]
MYFLFILGTAGSGKSYLTSALAEWLEDHELSVTRVNLDPAVEWLPYSPDVDVRDYVEVRKVMEKYGLGPNGALITSVDMLVSYIDKIRDEIEALRSNYVIVDTPGQLELFAFRQSGPYITSLISQGYKSLAIYLIDSFFTHQPTSFVSALLLAISVHLRLGIPQIHVLSKSDLISSDRIEKVQTWLSDPLSLIDEIEQDKVSRSLRDVAIQIEKILGETGLVGEVIPVSSKTGEGLDELYGEIQRILAGGEDYLTEEASGPL